MAKRGTRDPDHILHGQLAGLPDLPRERLKSRRPFVPAAWKLLNDIGRIIDVDAPFRVDGAQSILNAHPYSMFSFPGPILGPLEWACPEHFR